MKKWFASKEAKKITVIILILCMSLIAQFISFLHFNKNLYDLALEHAAQQVEELSVYVEKSLYLELDHHIQTLELIESQLEGSAAALSSAEITKQLQTIHSASDFQMMGLSNLDGNGVDSAGNPYSISYDHLREHIQRDEVYISNVLKNGGETLIFIAVPLKVNGQISGILWGKHALADIVNSIEFNNDVYKYFQIIDDKGSYLLSSKSKFALNQQPEFSSRTIWEELDKYHYPTGTSVHEIHESVQRGECGSFYFESGAQGRYVSYRPLKINNWYLFSVQVDDGLHDYVYHTRKITIHLFIILSIGLLTIFGVIYNLIYTMYKKMAKQNREIQAINGMFRETLQQTKNVPFVIDYTLKQITLYGYPAKDMVHCCSFADIRPEIMVKKGLDAGSLETYKKLYQSLIKEQKKCEPEIIYSQLGKEKEWIRVSISSPAQDSTDQMIGVLENYGEQKKKDLQIETHLDDIKKIEKKSQIDFLTTLYNRETFIEKMNAALASSIRHQMTGALLILDLDYFKSVNDRMGHGMGDIVLQKTAAILRNFFRREDIVGRLGGDEFVVFAQNIRNIPAFEQRIKDLNHLLCKTYYKDGKSIQVSASIGIALTDAGCSTFTDLYEKADQALYQVKQADRNGYQIYSETDQPT